ncbi:unnamed protein product [Arctogadus glacialis]
MSHQGYLPSYAFNRLINITISLQQVVRDLYPPSPSTSREEPHPPREEPHPPREEPHPPREEPHPPKRRASPSKRRAPPLKSLTLQEKSLTLQEKSLILQEKSPPLKSLTLPDLHPSELPSSTDLSPARPLQGSGEYESSKMATEKRMSSSRKHNMKSFMLTVAKDLLEAEAVVKAEERDKFLQDNCPPLDVPYSREELTELCLSLHDEINLGEEEKYGIEFKLGLVLNEVRDLNIKIVDLRGKFKKPKLKKVRMSADAMLKALLGSKHTVNMDLRSNLKQVKKEVKEEDKQLRDAGDWRKNIEDKSDRKKMFDS